MPSATLTLTLTLTLTQAVLTTNFVLLSIVRQDLKRYLYRATMSKIGYMKNRIYCELPLYYSIFLCVALYFAGIRVIFGIRKCEAGKIVDPPLRNPASNGFREFPKPRNQQMMPGEEGGLRNHLQSADTAKHDAVVVALGNRIEVGVRISVNRTWHKQLGHRPERWCRKG